MSTGQINQDEHTFRCAELRVNNCIFNFEKIIAKSDFELSISVG